MVQPIEPKTERLRLRQWRHTDFARFAEMNADPKVMEYFPTAMARSQSDALAQRCHSLIAERGWGLWAAELKCSGEFIGFVGLHTSAAELPFSPCLEVGWRLASQFWGNGYATEGGRAALKVAFGPVAAKEVVSITAVRNIRSRAVMVRLGMREAGLFEHPNIPTGRPLRPHCLYRLSVEDYDAQP
jgi:RimJ/RimL family protein N-acetyltransferase